jgi:uncharacterized protein (DUF433 family)
VLVDRVTLAAWRLQGTSSEEKLAARSGEAPAPVSRDDLRAERSLEMALDLLEVARGARRFGWGSPAKGSERLPDSCRQFADSSSALDEASYSNEWPTIPDHDYDEESDPARDSTEEENPPRWQDRLVFDSNVSDSSPVVKGTWITVSHVVSLIVDGWSWSDVLRAHPELTEDDIRTCLAYTVDQDSSGEY